MELERRLAAFKQTEADRRLSERLHRERRHRRRAARPRRRHRLRRTESRQHHRRRPPESRRRSRCFRTATSTLRARILADLPRGQRTLLITDGVFSMDGDLGALPGALRPRRRVRLHHDGGRRARERRVRRAGPRHGRSLRSARTRGRPGRHAVEGARRARRATSPARDRSSSSSIDEPGRSCSRRRIRRRSRRPAWRRSTCSRPSRSGWNSCGHNTRFFKAGLASARLRHRRRARARSRR